MPRFCWLGCASMAALTLASSTFAQAPADPATPQAVASQPAITLPPIVVSRKIKPVKKRAVAAAAPPAAPPAQITVTPAKTSPGPPPIKERYQLPQTAESITAERIERTINVVDTSDAVKYMPSLFVRKRNEGDNQAVLATRSWGLSSSARSLIYADDILLSALIGNNNSNAAPRWGMVAPEEIQRIDFLYGPFSAAYPGNSMGGVLNITTRMPDKFAATLKQSESFQSFSFYNTRDTYRTDQTSATIGNRWGPLSGFVSFNYQNSFSQPLAWVTTAAALPAGTSGVIPQPSRIGGVANVLGAGGLLHTEQFNTKGKFALDINAWLTATYTVGFFSNDQKSRVQTYLTDAAGNPTYGGSAAGSAFASNYYNLNQQQLANALSLRSDTKGDHDFDIALTRYDYLQDIQRNPFTVAATGANFINTGKIARLDGTNWTTFDAKDIWRLSSPVGPHEVSYGFHFDQYVLNNPTYQTPTWFGGPDATGQLYSIGNGKTQTNAVWAQDAWRFAPGWKLTLGGRGEWWQAYDGFNLSTTTAAATGAITGTTALAQPSLSAARFSPKAALAFEPNKDWLFTASAGIANRFPTVTELYQNATVAGVVVFPNPNLSPEQALATEFAAERRFSDGKVRLSLFEDDTRNALISQSGVIAGTTTPTAFVTNVDKVRTRGVEVAWQKADAFIKGLEWFGSTTYADPVILSDPSFVSTTGTTATGRRIPNVPTWRATFGGTWRPDAQWSWTLAGRYQSKTYSTLDNTDTVQNVFQAFDPFLVFDTRVQYQVDERGSISLGIDNIFNEKYHLFHPFPQRTYVMQGRIKF